MDNNLIINEFQEQLKKAGISITEENKNEIIKSIILNSLDGSSIQFDLTKFRRTSVYKPKYSQIAGDHQKIFELYAPEPSIRSFPYTLLETLHKNRNTQTNITFLEKESTNSKNLSRDLSQWFSKDLVCPIKEEFFKNVITLMCIQKGIKDIVWSKNNRYFMFNPTIIIPFIKNDRNYDKYDFWCFVYKFIQYKRVLKGAKHNAFVKKYTSRFINEVGLEKFSKLTKNIDDFSEALNNYIRKQEGDKYE